MKRWHYFLLFGIFIVLSFLLYGNTIGGDFVYDDFFLAERKDLREASHLLHVWSEPLLPNNITAGLFRPLTVFSFNLNFVLFGESPLSFHILNIILNGFIIFLIFILCQRLFKNWLLSLFITLLWAFLPIHSEAVASIKGREEILSAFFGLSSWILFLSASEDDLRLSYRKISGSALFYLLAVLAKELIIVLPALFLLALISRRKISILAFLKTAAIFVLTASSYMLWRYLVLSRYAFAQDILYFAINPLAFAPFGTRIQTAFEIAFLYISKTFVPWNLTASYHYNHLPLVNNMFESWQAMAGLAFLLVLVVLAFFSKRTRNAPIGLGALSFLIPYSVFSKFMFKGGDLMAERWIYFPSIGLSFIGGFLLYLLCKKRKWLGIAALLVTLVIYALVLIPRNLVWRSAESLYKSITETAPKSIMGHWGLSRVYLDRNLLDMAKKEAEIALAIDPEYPPLLNTLGDIAYRENNYTLARDMYVKAIEAAPHVAGGYQNATMVYYKMGEYEKAEKMLQYLVTRWPRPRAEDVVDYALVLAIREKYEESLFVIQKYYGGDFKDPELRLVLAVDYYKLGKLDEAKKYFDWNPTLREEDKIKLLKEWGGKR